jgi:hypothetical protein
VVSPTPDAERFHVAGAPSTWERCLGHSTLYGFVAYRLPGAAGDFAVGRRIRELPTEQGLEQLQRNLGRFADAVEDAGGILVVCAEATAARDDVAPEWRSCMGSTEAEIERTILIFETLRATLQAFATQRGLLYLDASAEVPPNPEYLGDMIHLTAAGEQRLARFLADHLRAIVERRQLTQTP